jgi:SAM-dependent methyltransferase
MIEMQGPIGEGILLALDQQRPEVEYSRLEHVRSKLRDYGNPGLDYEHSWREFHKLYSVINYRKVLAALKALRVPVGPSVLDLGCGTGAAALAALDYARLQPSGEFPKRVVLVDISERQVAAATSNLKAASRALNATLEIDSVTGDLQSLPRAHNFDLILAAHVLGENRDSLPSIFRTLKHSLNPLGVLLAIERPGDPALAELSEMSDRSQFQVSYGTSSVLGEVNGGPIRDWGLSWLSLQPRDHAPVVQAIHNYLQAWRQQSVDLLDEVFAPGAFYHERPLEPPLSGIDEIKAYWRREVLSQRNPCVEVLEALVGGSHATIEWIARFERGSYRYLVRGLMVVEVDPETGKIRNLRETFQSQKQPI